MEAQGLGTSDEEITSIWRLHGQVKSKRGQLHHVHAERLLNSVEIDEPHLLEFLQLMSMYRSLLSLGLK